MSVILASVVAVTGSIQFWERSCDDAGNCSLPRARSERIPVSGEVTEPARAGQVSVFELPVGEGALATKFQVFWVLPPDGSTPYLVAQAKLMDGTKPITECTQYAPVAPEKYFPVGMCSGFVPAEGGQRQVGVTFYK